MIKMPLRILGASEDTEMEDGTGSKLHTSQMEKNLSPDINTQPFLSEHS